MTGTTFSANFPTTPGAYQTTYRGGDGFITKINPTGDALLYSTFLGGAGCNGIAIDASGNAYVTGESQSLNFPLTPGSFQTPQMGFDTFITKLNETGSELIYSSRFGGNFDDSDATSRSTPPATLTSRAGLPASLRTARSRRPCFPA